MRLAYPDESTSRALAAATAVAVVFLTGRLLMREWSFEINDRTEPLRVSFVQRPRIANEPMVPIKVAVDSERQRHDQPEPHAASAPTRGTTPVRDLPQTMTSRVYTSLGQVRVPAQSRIDPMKAPEIAAQPPGLPNERELARAREVLERKNPINYERTRFDKDWKSDGTLGDVAMQSLGRGTKKVSDFIFGEDIQSPVARPPPDVRYNPALYEQKSDLGRAETGDVYKAAPITFEKAPDLKGEASRRIRASMVDLQQRVARCDAQKVRTLLQPVRTHLTELEQVEHALANGADPVMAAQMLPRRGDSAYDLARRALWYADKQLADCRQ